MAEVVVFVGGLGGDFEKDDDGEVGGEVGERMHGIRDHGGAMAEDAGEELRGRERGIQHGAEDRDLADVAFAKFSRVLHVAERVRVNRVAAHQGLGFRD